MHIYYTLTKANKLQKYEGRIIFNGTVNRWILGRQPLKH